MTTTVWGLEDTWTIEGAMKVEKANSAININPYNIASVTGVGEGNLLRLVDTYGKIDIPISKPLYRLSSAYYDKLCQKDGVWGIERKVGAMVLDGSEDWETVNTPAYSNSNTVLFQCSSKGNALLWDGVCTHFDVFHKEEQRTNIYDGISFGQDLSHIYLRIMKVRNVTTVEQLKNYLKGQSDEGHPVTFYYVQAESDFEPFDETVQNKLNNTSWQNIGFYDKNLEKLTQMSTYVNNEIFVRKEMKNDIMKHFLSSVRGLRVYGSIKGERFFVEGLYPKTNGLGVAVKSTNGTLLYTEISFKSYNFLSTKPVDVLLQSKQEAGRYIWMQVDLSQVEVPQQEVKGFSLQDTGIQPQCNVQKELVMPQYIPVVTGVSSDFYMKNAVLYGTLDEDAPKIEAIEEDMAVEKENIFLYGNIADNNIPKFTFEHMDNFTAKTQWISVNKDAGAGKEKTVLLLGDSLLNQDLYSQNLVELFSKDKMQIALLGTRGPETARHEGRGGWSAYDYCNVETKYGFTNPFLHNGTFDFSYYMQQNGWNHVDDVVIQLGINDLNLVGHNNHKEIFSYYDTMIQSIHKYNKNVRILLNQPPLLFEQAQTQYAKDTRLSFIQEMQKVYGNRESEGIFLVPLYIAVDPNKGYKLVEQNINEFNQNRNLIVTDTTHPNHEGYQSIAEMTYAFIKYLATLEE